MSHSSHSLSQRLQGTQSQGGHGGGIMTARCTLNAGRDLQAAIETTGVHFLRGQGPATDMANWGLALGMYGSSHYPPAPAKAETSISLTSLNSGGCSADAQGSKAVRSHMLPSKQLPVWKLRAG